MPILALPGLQTRDKLQLVDYYSGYGDTSSESGIHNFPASTTTVVSYPIAPITVVEAVAATKTDATTISVRNITYDGANLWVAPLSLTAAGGFVYKLDANYNEIASFASPVSPSGDIYGIRAMCWDGQYLWLVCRNQYSVDPPLLAQVDPADGSVVRTLPSPELCRGIEWVEGFLWICNETDDLIQKLDPADGTVLASYAQPPPPPNADALGDWPMGGLAYDGTYLWYCHESPPDSPSGEYWDRIYKLDLNNNLDVLESLYGTKGNFDLTYVDGHLFTGHYRPELVVKYQPSTLPVDFLNIETLQYRAVARINAAHDDSFTLRVRIMSGATVLAAADSAGGFVTVGAVSGTAWTTFGSTAFGYVNTAATEAQWDAATVEIEQVFSQNMGGDGCFIQLDVMDFSGTYNAEITQKIVNVGQAVETSTARPLNIAAVVQVGQALEADTAHAVTRISTVPVGQAAETDQAHPVTSPTEVSVAIATETSLARAVAREKTVHVGQAVEADSAHAVTSVASVPVGQAVETSTARDVARTKTLGVGQALEADTAHAITSRLVVQVGQATEVSAAHPVDRVTTVPVGQAVETDTAHAIRLTLEIAVGQAAEISSAHAITRAKVVAVGQAVETSSAHPITSTLVVAVGQALEADSAHAVTRVTEVAVGQAVESSAPQAVTAAKEVATGQAIETDQALRLQGTQVVAVGQAVEGSLARPVTAAKVIDIGQAVEASLAWATAREKQVLLQQAIELDLAHGLTALITVDVGQAVETDLALAVGAFVGWSPSAVRVRVEAAKLRTKLRSTEAIG